MAHLVRVVTRTCKERSRRTALTLAEGTPTKLGDLNPYYVGSQKGASCWQLVFRDLRHCWKRFWMFENREFRVQGC